MPTVWSGWEVFHQGGLLASANCFWKKRRKERADPAGFSVASGDCKSQSKEVLKQTKPYLLPEWQHQELFHGHLKLVVNRNEN